MEFNERKSVIPVVSSIILVFAYLGVIIFGKSLLGEEFSQVMLWWGALLFLGASCLPLTSVLFSGYHDGGFLFSKTIGLALSGWLLWVCSSLHILKFTRTNCFIIVILVCLLNIAGYVIVQKKASAKQWLGKVKAPSKVDSSQKVVLALIFELFFLVLFILACYVKCYKPEAYGTEKFMDYGFMTTMMRTEYMPPEDFWYSGTNLNYYYMGQYMATFLTKLSGVTVNTGYNLALAMLFAFCFMLVYSIIFEVMMTTIELHNKKKQQKAMQMKNDNYSLLEGTLASLLAHVAGALAGTAVTLAGNAHYIVFARVIPEVQNMLGLEVTSYWFPDATRYIGYNPDTEDKTIHEFPSYSFVLGDLHAHVTNIMFVLTVLGILYAWLLYRKNKMDEAKAGEELTSYSRKLEIFHPSIIMIGFFIGLFQMTNYWDFPIYYVVAGAIILFSNAVIHNFKKETLILTAYHGILVLGIGVIVSLLFNLRFDSMAKGIALCMDHTPLYQFAILWGLPITVLIGYIVSLIFEKKEVTYQHKKGSQPLLYQFINRLTLPELFILTIGLCAFGLVILPEIIYVVDIYSGHKRANTMFKFTYQGFIMFGMMMGYIVTKFILLCKNMKQLIFGILTGCFLLGTVGYFGISMDSWFGDVTEIERFQGLDAGAFVLNENIYDAEAIAWINENIEGIPVMLESNGDSYTYANRVSVLTGLPTLLGWFTHEWLWKDSYDLANERAEIVKQIYTSTDIEVIRSLVEEYKVEYIYVGDQERIKFAETGVNDAGLKSLGEIVFANEGVYIIEVNVY